VTGPVPVPLGRTLSPEECRGACAYGSCGGGSGPDACGGCCGCLGACFDAYKGREVRRQYRVSDRHLVLLLLRARQDNVAGCCATGSCAALPPVPPPVSLSAWADL
jgi:hypothetical protein